MAEVLAAYANRIDGSAALARLGLEPRSYYLVSMHREENIDDPSRLETLVRAISHLGDGGTRVIVSTHPRLAKRLADRRTPTGIVVDFLPPFGYLDYSMLQRHARCVLSDSGTVSEESAISGFPAVTIRDAMERPEALDAGSIVLSGLEAESILGSVALVTRQWEEGWRPAVPADYRVSDVSVRVGRLIQGLTAVHPTWSGVRAKSWRSERN